MTPVWSDTDLDPVQVADRDGEHCRGGHERDDEPGDDAAHAKDSRRWRKGHERVSHRNGNGVFVSLGRVARQLARIASRQGTATCGVISRRVRPRRHHRMFDNMWPASEKRQYLDTAADAKGSMERSKLSEEQIPHALWPSEVGVDPPWRPVMNALSAGTRASDADVHEHQLRDGFSPRASDLAATGRPA